MTLGTATAAWDLLAVRRESLELIRGRANTLTNWGRHAARKVVVIKLQDFQLWQVAQLGWNWTGQHVFIQPDPAKATQEPHFRGNATRNGRVGDRK